MTIVFENVNINTRTFESLKDLLIYICDDFFECCDAVCPFYEAEDFSTDRVSCLVSEYIELLNDKTDSISISSRMGGIREKILKRILLHKDLLNDIVEITTIQTSEEEKHKTVIEIEKKERS